MSSEALEARLDDLRQVCFAPSDGYSAGEWCEAANEGVQIALALLAEVARLEQERDEALERVRVRHGDVRKSSERAEQAYRERDEALAALAVAREREHRLHEAAAALVAHFAGDDVLAEDAAEDVQAVRAALVDEPAAAGAGHNLCACGSTLIVCAKCGDSRCLVCDPYDELDTCGATEPAAATLAEPREAGEGDTRGSTSPVGPLRDGRGSASAAADEPGETPCRDCGAIVTESGYCVMCGRYNKAWTWRDDPAADEPGETPQVRRGVGRIVGHRDRPPMVVGDDEPGETP